MKTFRFILILSIISTGYLFSQVEENEIIKEDTVINIDSIAVTKVDTTIVGEPVNRLDTVNTFAINDCKKTGIISAKLLGNGYNLGFSATLDIPISCNINIASIYSNAIGGLESDSPYLRFFGVGLGYVFINTDHFILKSRTCLGLLLDRNKGFNELQRPGLHLGADILFRVKFIALSIGPDFFVPFKGKAIYSPAMVSFGLGIVYF